MEGIDKFIDYQCEHIRKRAIKMSAEHEKEKAGVLHSLPISTEVRDKREHEAEEWRRFTDMPGVFKFERNGDGFITRSRKQVEDIVLDTVYTRDSDNYITGINTKIELRGKV